MAVKVVAFSDVHGQQGKRLTKWFKENSGDILLFAGDLQRNHFDVGVEFIRWVNSFSFKHKVLIWGNHDNNYEIMAEAVNDFENTYFLNNESITVEGLKIFGSPYAPTFGNWSFMASERELAEMYAKIPADTDILLTHTPPHGVLDKWEGGESVGSIALARAIDKLPNLRLSVFGHIHEESGSLQDESRNLTYVNAALLDERYALRHQPQIIYFESTEETIRRVAKKITVEYKDVWTALSKE